MKTKSFRVTLPDSDAALLAQAVRENIHSMPGIRGQNTATTFFAKAAIRAVAADVVGKRDKLHWYAVSKQTAEGAQTLCRDRCLSPVLLVERAVQELVERLTESSDCLNEYRAWERKRLRAVAETFSPSGDILKTEFGQAADEMPSRRY